MPELISCEVCKVDIHRDDWPAHHGSCRPLLATPRLPVSAFLLRVEKGRVHISSLGPTLMLGVTFVEADFSLSELQAWMEYIRLQVEGQG
jgi:hypothetical protein